MTAYHHHETMPSHSPARLHYEDYAAIPADGNWSSRSSPVALTISVHSPPGAASSHS